ncbi:MAG: hypothetical protein U1F71_08300 [Verrucomicrobiaceae bacterium]
MAAIAQKEHDEYVRLNRRTVNQYEGVNDPVEIASIMLEPKKHDPLIVYAPPPLGVEELFASFSEEQAMRLASLAKVAMAEEDTDRAEDIAKSLATLTDFDLTEMLREWVSRKHYWPSIIFRSAKPEIRDAIIASLDRGEANANHALSALAWIGDEVVQSAFVRWDAEKPVWAAKLYLSPSGYSVVGGWKFAGGKRSELTFNECYALLPSSRVTEASPVNTFQSAGQACPWCGYELSWMFDFDPSDSRLGFYGVKTPRFRVLTCHGCTCYGDGFYAKIGADGMLRPHSMATRPKWLPDHSEPWSEPAWKNVEIALSPRRAIQAADWCMDLKSSQLGGHPTWVQDSIYPKCPDCSQTMRFIGQLNEGDFPSCEGTYYAFYCHDCQSTATTYQQT